MRPQLLNPLFRDTLALKGVGTALVKPLEKLRLTRARDLLYHAPSYWVQRQRITCLDDAREGEHIIAELTPRHYRQSSQRAPLRVEAFDAAGNHVSLTFFGRNPGWPKKLLPLGEPRIISGKLERYGDALQIVHPDHIEPPGSADIPEFEPVYPLSDGISNGRMRQLIAQALGDVPDLPEWIEPGLLAREGWPAWRAAVHMLHHGDSAAAKERLAYDEIFANQLALMLNRQHRRRKTGQPILADGRLRDALTLPFTPTGAQRRAIAEIAGDVAQPVPMLRLLQGDVGSGKTLVALMALLMAVEGGMQGAMLAPTEILARQHFASLRAMLSGLPVTIAILTGREKGRVREATLMGLADGSIHLLVGTHAIFQEAVQYKSLGLVVIDEQHRFGVSQRLMLADKAQRAPHVLTMTATPIPRTLTLSHYGEMDVSRLDELPAGRQPIDTRVIAEDRIGDIVTGLARHLADGHQAFWVCPLVEESAKSDLAAAEARAAALRARFGERVGLVHGRMKGEDKDAVMERFVAGEVQLLVATTVIEVGVDVPRASLMIIEAADRFGLAQLHQLRGRVGRGTLASHCILIRSAQLSPTAKARLALMRETNDGFRIAEEDLKLRGGGDVLGTRQSGEQSLNFAGPEQVQKWIQTATDDARLLLDRDGGLSGTRGQAARLALYLFERDWGIRLIGSG